MDGGWGKPTSVNSSLLLNHSKVTCGCESFCAALQLSTSVSSLQFSIPQFRSCRVTKQKQFLN